MSKKNLFVTLADSNYLEQAKQLFSSLYFNAGWNGDCMLLAHDVSEEDVAWFRKRGILIKHCAPLFEGWQGGMSTVITSKFYLFTPEFKKWSTVIYSDADAIVRASLDALCGLQGFHSVIDTASSLELQVVSKKAIKKRSLDVGESRKRIRDIKKEYDMKKASFCAGFFAFGTDIIDGENVFNGLCQMLRRISVISAYGDQLAFNLCFYERWRRLPVVYNFQVMGENNSWLIPPREVRGIVIHFVSPDKPWIRQGYFYQEWKNNLDRANFLDLNRIPKEKTVWDPDAIKEVDVLLKKMLRSKLKYVRLAIDWLFGRLGRFCCMANEGVYKNLIDYKNHLSIDRIFGVGSHIVPESMIMKLQKAAQKK